MGTYRKTRKYMTPGTIMRYSAWCRRRSRASPCAIAPSAPMRLARTVTRCVLLANAAASSRRQCCQTGTALVNALYVAQRRAEHVERQDRQAAAQRSLQRGMRLVERGQFSIGRPSRGIWNAPTGGPATPHRPTLRGGEKGPIDDSPSYVRAH